MKPITIKLSEKEIAKKRAKPELMDMTIWRPRKSKVFGSLKDYTRKQKHKKDWE